MSNNTFICPTCKVATHRNEKSFMSQTVRVYDKLLRKDINCESIHIQEFICGYCERRFFNFYFRSPSGYMSKISKEIHSDNFINFPEYVPHNIRQDYEEACIIKELSPKSSATLARRALQGMIRNYWGIKGKSLYDEINQIKDKVDPATFDAIDAVRKIGNIGAHMERDVNVIIDIEPSEAGLLINLIEELIDDWYIAREQRRLRNEKLQQKADEIQQLKQGN